MAQRISRAKATLRDLGEPFDLPVGDRLEVRVGTCPRRAVPPLQRGVRREHRARRSSAPTARPRRSGWPGWPTGCCPRPRGVGPARPDAPARRAAPGPGHGSGRPGPARRAGPLAVGPPARRRGHGAARLVAGGRSARALPGAGGHRRRARPGADGRRHRLAAGARALRAARGGGAEPLRHPGPGRGAGRGRGPGRRRGGARGGREPAAGQPSRWTPCAVTSPSSAGTARPPGSTTSRAARQATNLAEQRHLTARAARLGRPAGECGSAAR